MRRTRQQRYWYGSRVGHSIDDEAVPDLLDHLCYLPLAIRQASAYLANTKALPLREYLNYCRNSDDKFIELLSKALKTGAVTKTPRTR